MRCIEIKRIKLGSCADSKINRNMRCIEIPVTGGNFKLEQLINRNMRCIEIKGASIAFRGTYRLIET